MMFHPIAQELRPGIKDKISRHFLPYILKFVMIIPNIIPGPGDYILAGLRDKSGGASLDIRAHISVTLEDSQVIILILRKNRVKKASKRKEQQYVK
jgi:hypothetical protein